MKRKFRESSKQSQLIKTQEELKELDEAIQKLIDLRKYDKRTSFYNTESDFLKDHIAEELADVRIMLDQIEYGLKIEQRCTDWREMKLTRQLQRITNEN